MQVIELLVLPFIWKSGMKNKRAWQLATEVEALNYCNMKMWNMRLSQTVRAKSNALAYLTIIKNKANNTFK